MICTYAARRASVISDYRHKCRDARPGPEATRPVSPGQSICGSSPLIRLFGLAEHTQQYRMSHVIEERHTFGNDV